jgi:hypothetical protein
MTTNRLKNLIPAALMIVGLVGLLMFMFHDSEQRPVSYTYLGAGVMMVALGILGFVLGLFKR